MKLYIWEGRGISGGYHDDGVLVVLAESAEQARAIVRAGRFDHAAWNAERDAYLAALSDRTMWWKSGKGAEIWARLRYDSDYFDGSDEALDREPDRVIETDEPTWVAFNRGGDD